VNSISWLLALSQQAGNGLVPGRQPPSFSTAQGAFASFNAPTAPARPAPLNGCLALGAAGLLPRQLLKVCLQKPRDLFRACLLPIAPSLGRSGWKCLLAE